MRPVRLYLSDGELDEVCELARAEGVEATVVRVFAMFGVDLTADGPSISPSCYALPASQWESIAGALAERDRAAGPFAGLSNVLAWVNIGPSGYDEAEAVAS